MGREATSSPLPDWSGLSSDRAETRLTELTGRLASIDGGVDEAGVWPDSLWALLHEFGVVRWSMPSEFGGEGCDRPALLTRYARVAEGSLTAAFILSQHDAAVRRLVNAGDRRCARAWLGMLAAADAFATVGISQLTTSRRHGTSALTATEVDGGYRLDGVMPWVTAAEQADVIVTGAAFGDGRQVLLAVPTDRPRLTVMPPFPLAALQSSCTAEVVCDGVEVVADDLLAGPSADVMAQPGTAGTGGLETSALALGQARAAINALAGQATHRDDLAEPVEALALSWQESWAALMAAAAGGDDAPAPGDVRGQSNALVLSATQAFLTARKGSGFLKTDPAQRWARQALFFLVWSCPGPVAQAAIRDLAGVCPI